MRQAALVHLACLLSLQSSANEPQAMPLDPTDDEAVDLLPATEPPTGPAAQAVPLGRMPDDIAQAARESRNLPLGARMKAVSEPMLGKPYLIDPLGEGEGHDADPLARYDAYDCLTFVEEVLALSLGADARHSAEVRLSLRYSGDPSYAHRRHFMELQWIPDNIEQGWLRDTTAEYGPVALLEREVTEATWRAWKRRGRFALNDSELPLGTMQLNILSLDDAIAAADRVRPGSIVLTVRQDRAWIPIWISHVGFTIPADKPTVRHATRMGAHKVRDHGLVWYLEHLKTYSNWPAIGVSILEPIEQGPRRALLID